MVIDLMVIDTVRVDLMGIDFMVIDSVTVDLEKGSRTDIHTCIYRKLCSILEVYCILVSC